MYVLVLTYLKDTLGYCIIDSARNSIIEQGRLANIKGVINSFLRNGLTIL